MKILAIFISILIFINPLLGNFWDTVFRGLGYEKMFLRMNDKKMLEYTTYNKLTIDRTDFFSFLRKKGYDVSQIKVCIHNHLYDRQFSDGDKKFYSQIKEAGFKGKFQVYFRGKIYNLKEGKCLIKLKREGKK